MRVRIPMDIVLKMKRSPRSPPGVCERFREVQMGAPMTGTATLDDHTGRQSLRFAPRHNGASIGVDEEEEPCVWERLPYRLHQKAEPLSIYRVLCGVPFRVDGRRAHGKLGRTRSEGVKLRIQDEISSRCAVA